MGHVGGDSYGPVNDRYAKVAFSRALSYGYNFIDTADIFGLGTPKADWFYNWDVDRPPPPSCNITQASR